MLVFAMTRNSPDPLGGRNFKEWDTDDGAWTVETTLIGTEVVVAGGSRAD